MLSRVFVNVYTLYHGCFLRLCANFSYKHAIFGGLGLNLMKLLRTRLDNKISRREVIKGAAVGVSGMALTPIAPLISPGTSERIVEPVQASAAVSPADVVPLTSTSEVYVPPKHGGFLKFSFDFPEPSVEFEKLLFSFRIFTFENVYAPDRSRMTVTRDSNSLHIRCDGLVWAGGQQTAEGRLEAHVRRNGSFVEWNATASMNIPIKSIATILRRVPRGKISAGGGSFFDPKDDEQLFGYPFGGGSLFTAGGMDSPIVVIQSGEHEYFFLSSLLDKVRATRRYSARSVGLSPISFSTPMM